MNATVRWPEPTRPSSYALRRSQPRREDLLLQRRLHTPVLVENERGVVVVTDLV